MPGESTPTAPNGQPGAAPVGGDPDDPVRVALQRTNRHPIKLARLFVNAQREQAQAVADLTARLETATRALAAYEALGTPETLTAAVQERDTLTAREAQRDARRRDPRAGRGSGLRPRIVERLSRDPDAAFDVTGVADGARRHAGGQGAARAPRRHAGRARGPRHVRRAALRGVRPDAPPAAAPASPADGRAPASRRPRLPRGPAADGERR
jgi:hypothetical protein